jgi:hypothetical protein
VSSIGDQRSPGDPVDVLPGGLPDVSPFAPTSRYAGLPLATVTIAGTVHPYVTRRFLPDPDELALLVDHVVVSGDRPDLLAFRYLGDAELFWRLCDANRVMFPTELTATIGRRLRVTLPPGFPGGAPDA